MRSHMSTLGGLAALLLFLSGLLGEIPAEVNSARGQTLYVPVYSEIPYGIVTRPWTDCDAEYTQQ